MQTFLPYKDFYKSAKSLDRQRLGKQRVECLQILKALSGETDGWKNHPATKMWADYPFDLINYGLAICTEWRSRGYKDTCFDKILAYRSKFNKTTLPVGSPAWLGQQEFHRAHQSNLIRKDPEFYKKQFGNEIPDNLEYIWPA